MSGFGCRANKAHGGWSGRRTHGCSTSAPCMHACEVIQEGHIDRLTVVIHAAHAGLFCLPEAAGGDWQGEQVDRHNDRYSTTVDVLLCCHT